MFREIWSLLGQTGYDNDNNCILLWDEEKTAILVAYGLTKYIYSFHNAIAS